MSNFSYKRTTVTSLKAAGILDTDNMTISVDGEEKSLAVLLSDFNGAEIDLKIGLKTEEEIDEPTDSANNGG